MKLRLLIIPCSLILFAPAALLFWAGLMLIPAAVAIDIGKGHLQTALLVLPLGGGGIGLISAFLLTFDIAGKPIGRFKVWLKRLGLVAGCVSELWAIHISTPNWEPFFIFWLPPLIGAVVLFGLSFFSDTSKLPKQPASAG